MALATGTRLGPYEIVAPLGAGGIFDHPGVEPFAVTHPLARLGLARAKMLAGDTAAARTHYQDFLALWKDADPDVPILSEAKAEYERLK